LFLDFQFIFRNEKIFTFLYILFSFSAKLTAKNVKIMLFFVIIFTKQYRKKTKKRSLLSNCVIYMFLPLQ